MRVLTVTTRVGGRENGMSYDGKWLNVVGCANVM